MKKILLGSLLSCMFIGSIKPCDLDVNLFGWTYKGPSAEFYNHFSRSAGRIGAASLVGGVAGLISSLAHGGYHNLDYAWNGAKIGCGSSSAWYTVRGMYHFNKPSGQGDLAAGVGGLILMSPVILNLMK